MDRINSNLDVTDLGLEIYARKLLFVLLLNIGNTDNLGNKNPILWFVIIN